MSIGGGLLLELREMLLPDRIRDGLGCAQRVSIPAQPLLRSAAAVPPGSGADCRRTGRRPAPCSAASRRLCAASPARSPCPTADCPPAAAPAGTRPAPPPRSSPPAAPAPAPAHR